MSNIKKLMMTAAGGGGLNVEEVFSTYLYEGNGSTQTITNGIDLAGEGGLVWIKNRDVGFSHYLTDTINGTNIQTSSDTTGISTSSVRVTGFNSNGFALGGNAATNGNTYGIASWTFRKAPKFFDVVTYTGNGNSGGRYVSHNLGTSIGFIMIKRTDSSGEWVCGHRSTFAVGRLNSTAAWSTSLASGQPGDEGGVNLSASSSTQFFVNNGANGVADVNASGGTYVAYLFAHNNGDGEFGPAGNEDIIKCGSYTGNYPSDVTVDLGFEAQWILFRNINTTSNWVIYDTIRGFAYNLGTQDADFSLAADSSAAENGVTGSAPAGYPAPDGFVIKSGLTATNANGDTIVYVAIRRGPMAVPEDANNVFEVVTRSGTSTDTTVSTGFPVDFIMSRGRNGAFGYGETFGFYYRLGGLGVTRSDDGAEFTRTAYQIGISGFDSNSGMPLSGSDNDYGLINRSGVNYATYFFQRASGFFDLALYTGTGSSSLTVDHNLGAVPEMMWVKRRSGGGSDWKVYHKDLTNLNSYLLLNTSAAEVTNQTNVWPTAPTATQLTIGNYTGNYVGGGDTGIACLFATVSGVSKVGSVSHTQYTDTNVDCGFSSGARFILIKRSSGTGSWYVFDTERGIVSGDDKAFFLQTQLQEQTADWIDPYSSGFTMVGASFDTGTYIFLAIA